MCVQLEGYKYAGDDQKKDIKMRFFHTNNNIRANHVFHPAVSCPTPEDRKPRVDWTKFHSIIPVHQEDENHSDHLHSLMQVWRQSSKPTHLAILIMVATTQRHTCDEMALHVTLLPNSHLISTAWVALTQSALV